MALGRDERWLEEWNQETVWRKVHLTFYTLDPVETGKKPGDKGYGIGKSGWPVQMGDVAVHEDSLPRLPFGTIIEIMSLDGRVYPMHLRVADTGDTLKQMPPDWADLCICIPGVDIEQSKKLGEQIMLEYGTRVKMRVVEMGRG